MKVEIEGQGIETQCYSCGDEIHLLEGEPFAVVFDAGTPDDRVTPGEPAGVVLCCHKCLNDLLGVVLGKKPICYQCAHRGPVRNSRHSSCHHPIAEDLTRRDLHRVMNGIITENKIPWLYDDLHVEFADQGIAQGYVLWPFNFDPIWLIQCTGFEEAR